MPACALTISASAQKRHSVAVGEAAPLAPRREIRLGVDDPRQLDEKPALSDAGDTDECDELRRAFYSYAVQRRTQRGKLSFASDEVTGDSSSTSVPNRARAWDASQTATGSDFPFASTGGRFAVVHSVSRGAICRLVDEHAVDRRGALETSGGVDDVAGGHSLAGIRLCIELDERLAGRDPHAELEPLLELRTRGWRAPHVPRAPDRPRAPTGAPKSAITASPMNFSTVPPYRSSSVRTRSWYGRRIAATSSGIHRLGPRREADEVAKDNSDDLALTGESSAHHAIFLGAASSALSM